MGHMKELDLRIRQGGDDAIAAVSELLPRWIPVSERLPEEGVHVLGFWIDDTSTRSYGGCSAIFQKDGRWFLSDDMNCETGIYGYPYTHWMPLPEPPEAK